jgi:hypothetical protein
MYVYVKFSRYKFMVIRLSELDYLLTLESFTYIAMCSIYIFFLRNYEFIKLCPILIKLLTVAQNTSQKKLFHLIR